MAILLSYPVTIIDKLTDINHRETQNKILLALT
ncbi:hypothetical protein GAB14E_1948 [Colwellia psychrerythraea]|uniref:Uncharacterized protein n=1 Tax=Colwellia psychrerythraea TaxID=28229 RepID=A0A099KX71_COLPS|nr:hypothetical protein GAB14E_1948 [Colwellia psychrerythraea]